MVVHTFAKALLVNTRGEILFLRRSTDDDVRPGGWDFPGGTMERDEDPLDGVIREIAEETGVDLAPSSLQLIYAAPRLNSFGVGCWLLFLAYVPDDVLITLSGEHSDYQWLTAAEGLRETDHPPHREILEFISAHQVLDAATLKTVTCRTLVVNPAGDLLLLRRSMTDPLHPGTWDLPGGRREPDERFVQTAVRETDEECGLRDLDCRLVYGTSNARPAGTGTWLFYLANAAAGAPITLSGEHDAYQWVPFTDLPKYTDYDVLTRMHTFVTQHTIVSERA